MNRAKTNKFLVNKKMIFDGYTFLFDAFGILAIIEVASDDIKSVTK